MTIRYFAYGSNLSREQMRDRCPTARLVGPAVLAGHRIGFSRYSAMWKGGVADVIDEPGHEVWGLLYELEADDLAALDRYEGYPDMYTRDQTTVETDDGAVAGVWVYRVRERLRHVPPTRIYLDVMLEAAEAFAFPAAYVEHLQRVPLTFVLVPGAGGQAWYWHRVVAELEARGHTAIAVDLPADDASADLDAYADTIVEAAAGREGIVLVAQSMGGFSAPLACDRLSVSLLVLVNAMIPRPGETGGEWWEATGQAQAAREFAAAQGRDPTGDLDLMDVFFHDVPAQVIEEAMAAGEPDQSDTPFAQPFPLDRWPDVPTRVVASRDDRLFPVEFQRPVAIDRLGILPDEVPGGHLVALAHPVPLVDQIEAYAIELAVQGDERRR